MSMNNKIERKKEKLTKDKERQEDCAVLQILLSKDECVRINNNFFVRAENKNGFCSFYTQKP